MIEKNRPEGILPLTVHRVDRRAEYWYDTTGTRCLTECAKDGEWIPEKVRSIMIRLQEIGRRMEQLLLEASHLWLKPDCVFLNEKGELQLCYSPESVSDSAKEQSQFLWFLLDHMNHDDAVSAAGLYQLYHSLQKEHLTAEEILRMLGAEIQRTERKTQECAEKQEAMPRDISGQTVKEISAHRYCTEYAEDFVRSAARKFLKKMRKEKKETVSNESAEFVEAEQSHCFLRSCGELILETSELNRSPFLIGSSRSECNLWIADPAVSRIHAKLLYEKGRWYLMDAGSVNGTRWNQVPVRRGERKELQPGDQLDFAGVIYVFDQLTRQEGNRLDNPVSSG